MMKHTIPEEVSTVLASYPTSIQNHLLALRHMILDVAAKIDGVGPLEETLKWGQISYLTSKTKSGTTIRIDAVEDNNEQVAMFVHCQTTLIETFRQMYSDIFEFEGNRCMRLNMDHDTVNQPLENCIALALTYHQSKK